MPKYIVAFLFYLLIDHGLLAQEKLNIAFNHACVYSGVLDEEIYVFESDRAIASMADEILQQTGSEKNFTLLEADVESVAAILYREQRYILYSSGFLDTYDKTTAYALLAHEIGHHIAMHSMTPSAYLREETEADEFMGFALFKMNGIRLSQVESVLHKIKFHDGATSASKSVEGTLRLTSVRGGWKRAESGLQVHQNLGFDENNTAPMDKLPIPRFPWPPPQCAQRKVLVETLSQKHRTLSDAEKKIRAALDAHGYGSSQRSYFQTPGGFAVVTQMEQLNADGSSKPGEKRWLDYPVQEDFDGILSYLTSLVRPTLGYFRLFVFIVTNAEYYQDTRRISKDEAMAWLTKGFNRLPEEIGKMPAGPQHSLEVLVYEFEAPQSTKVCTLQCPARKDVMTHLNNSGLGLLGF